MESTQRHFRGGRRSCASATRVCHNRGGGAAVNDTVAAVSSNKRGRP